MASIGTTFKTAREGKDLSLSKAAALTRIKIQHLEAMEQDDFSNMPAPVYAKGFIRMYAELLEINPDPLVDEYVRVHLEGEADTPHPALKAEPPPPPPARKPPPPEPVVDNVPPEPRPDELAGDTRTFPDPRAWLQTLSARCREWTERLPVSQILVVLAVVAVVIGISRCAGGGGEGAGMEAGPDQIRGDALIREPPEPFLPVKAQEP